MGLNPVGGSEKSFSEYFDLRTLLRYLRLRKFKERLNIYIIIPFNYLNLQKITLQEQEQEGNPFPGLLQASRTS